MAEGIFEYISQSRLVDLLKSYSDTFKMQFFLLGGDGTALLGYPENTHPKELIKKPLNLRGVTVGHIAVPASGTSAGAVLDFAEKNLMEILQLNYDINSLSGEVARNYEELSTLWDLTSRLGAGLDVDRICRVLAEEAMGICPSKNVSIMLVAEEPPESAGTACILGHKDSAPIASEKKVFFCKVSLGQFSDRALKMSLDADTGLIGYVYATKKPLTLYEASGDGRLKGFTYPADRILIVPLTVEDDVIGAIISSDKRDGEEFYSTEIKLIQSIATDCAVSIKKALLYDEIHETLFSTAEAFSLAMDAKDPYTYGHSKRVSEISADIAKAMGLPEETVSRVRLAALLHDIGKIGTPEVILAKVTSLEPDEMDRMKEHAYVGARMVENIRRMKEIAQWMCHHHERYDGSGYPSGLKGDEIPIPSRIIAIADFYDAITSDRPYKPALVKEDAIETMKKAVGTHLDPMVFEYFVKAVSPHG